MTPATPPLKITIAGAAGELGLETIRQLKARGHTVSGLSASAKNTTVIDEAGGLSILCDVANADQLSRALTDTAPDVVINLIPQVTNTLLHDGHAWKKFDSVLNQTTAAMSTAAAKAQVNYVVQTSYAFLYGNAQNATEAMPRSVPGNTPVFLEAIRADNAALTTKMPTCLLRLGYLYGPQSHDLLLYWKSFMLHRPYYAGKADGRANFLHFEDAARALTAVAERGPDSRDIAAVFNVADGSPGGLGAMIDLLAEKLGFSPMPHLPTRFDPLIVWITKEQKELLKLNGTVNSDKFRADFNWQPTYPSYREGITQTVETWRQKGIKP